MGNLTKAAELHYVSQLNITVAIKKLEEELGTKLFTREYKKVTLTPKGKRFYEAILPLLSNLQNIVDEIKDTRDKEEIPFSDLRNEPLIMMRLDSFHRQRIFDECAKAGFAPQIALSSNHIQSNIDSVASGIGLSFLLDKVTLHRDDVVLRSTSPRMKVTVGIAWPRNKYLSYASRDIISYLTDLYQTEASQE